MYIQFNTDQSDRWLKISDQEDFSNPLASKENKDLC